MNDLVTAVKSKEFIEDELKEFYATLTRPFTTLSQFIQEFSDLLVDQDSIQLKKGLLNTELRIFALIRLGIRIAQNICFPSLFCID
jgi:hypothetical protein